MRLHERVLKQDPGLDLRGEPLRGYRLLEKIDDGPTGVVFRAIQPHVERDVAVKIFHESIAADPEFVRRFDAEAQAVAALEHPHIVPIYDYWREPGRAYIVSRYLRGGSLRAMEERGESLERDRALRVVEQIASGARVRAPPGDRARERRSSNVLFDPRGQRLPRGLPDRDRLGAGPLGGRPGARPPRQAPAAERMPPSPELAERAEVGTECTGGGCVRRWPPARPSNPRRSLLLDGSTNGTPTRASGRSPRPTPATSSGEESSPGASSPG